MIHRGELGELELRCGLGGGGGGQSGKVEYPTYLQTRHASWLAIQPNGSSPVAMTQSMVDAMNTAFSYNPYTGVVAYDPTDAINIVSGIASTMVNYGYESSLTAAFSFMNDVAAALDTIVSSESAARIIADKAAYAAMVEAEVESSILPKFQRGMQNINAVQSSSYVVGEALIWASVTRDINKFNADLMLRSFSERNQLIVHFADMVIKKTLAANEFYRVILHAVTEYERVKIVAFKEKADRQVELDVHEATWCMEAYKYGGNVMAAISGAAATVNSYGGGTASAIGGAISGVGAGAAIGSAIPGVGSGIGAVIGGISGLLGSK